MAAESDGMVSGSGDEQPMDLSRASRKATRLMPPLIPISLLRGGYNHRRFLNKDSVDTKQVSVLNTDKEQELEQVANADDEEDDDDWRDNQHSPKRSRLDRDGWEEVPRLDRTRSVPQLTPLPPLQRHKSLSESRIPTATAKSREEESNDDILKSSWIYIGYYSQLLHRFQAQELLRQIAIQHQRESPDDKNEGEVAGPKSTITNASEESLDMKRRQARPLTGKHVRPGTGASPATLLSLRRKIQARQQQHDAQQIQK